MSLAIAAVAAGAVAALCLVAAARWGLAPELRGPVADGGWTARSRGWLSARGFFATEFDPATGQPYTWSADSARVAIPRLDRSQAYRVTVVASPGRPGGQPPPVLTLLVDGRAAAACTIAGDRTPCTAALPVRAEPRAVITMQIAPRYLPGGEDTRALGVIVHELALAPGSGHFTVSNPVLLSLAGAVALAVLGVLLCGVSGMLALAAAAGVAAASVWLLLQDGAFIGTYVDSLLDVATGAAIGGALVAVLRRVRPTIAGVPGWSIAAGIGLAALVVKLAFLNHPLATIGDGIFQIHRAQMVRGGAYFFTSVTPRPFFEFPYAIGLYVTSLPFWSFFPTDVDQVHLLRGAALGADALVGVGLYFALVRQWRDPRLGLLAAALWPFARAPFEALCNANLTNVFGQGLFGVAMAGAAWMAAAGASVPAVLITLAFMTGGYLSHFSTFSVGVPLAGLAAVALVAGGRGETRRAGWWLLAVGAAAVVLAYLVYYGHFTEIYRATWARLASHETVDAAGSNIAATPAIKLQRWASGTSDDYGLPGLVLGAAAAGGAWLLARRHRREGLTLVLGSWLATWVCFTVLGIVSAIQMRVNLAAAPVFVALGAVGLFTIGTRSRLGQIAAAAATLTIVVTSVRLWMMCLGR